MNVWSIVGTVLYAVLEAWLGKTHKTDSGSVLEAAKNLITGRKI